jgi:uncharacterized protein
MKFWIMIILGLAAAVLLGAFWWAGHELASPARRSLQDYHREFLAKTAEHGVTVQAFCLTDGTPCLMMEPLSDGRLGRRGKVIRDQLTAEGIELPPAGKIMGSLVLVHGRKGRKEDYLVIGERLCAAGFRCLLADMPAHGEHPEKVITFGLHESGIPSRLLSEASEHFHFSAQPAGLLGMSMGGAVAVHAAAREKAPWKALVVISSFDRLDTVIQSNVASRAGEALGRLWRAGAGWVYQLRTGVRLEQIRSDEPASRLSIPVLMAHGTADRVIPIESGRRLYQSLPLTTEKMWNDVPGADHHNVLITDFPIYAAVARWMLRHMKP